LCFEEETICKEEMRKFFEIVEINVSKPKNLHLRLAMVGRIEMCTAWLTDQH
jgi:hypothetical protein